MAVMSVPDFALQLRRYRVAAGLTQLELAERAHLSKRGIADLERGQRRAPRKETVALLAEALGLSADERARFEAVVRRHRTPLPSPLPHLPAPLTPLVGRQREVAALLELLGHKTDRLLTLTGPAGVGKTRLALQLAATLQRERGQEVVCVGLIPVQESARVLPAIAQALGVRDSGTLPLHDALVRALRDRDLVLVLDNFEQVLPAARALLDLLIACPRARALVTSRSALNVRGERCFPVEPLALPEPHQMDSVAALVRVPTVALFVERASAAWPAFRLASLEDGRLVADICARLDGLPLAIELAAARVRHFGLRQLRDRLAGPAFLGVLVEGPQDLADHQRTMRSTIAWSHDLLSPEQQRLFRWLGVFVGGVTQDALLTVTGVAEDALLNGLAALLNASLAQCSDPGSPPRYTQLVTLREYAEERLAASGEAEGLRRRHAAYYLALAEAAEPALKGPDWEIWQARLEADVGNLRTALGWARTHGEVELGLRLGVALLRFWYPFGRPSEGQAWLEELLALTVGSRGGAHEMIVRARALVGAAFLAYWQNRYGRAVALAEEGGALSREVGDTHTVAESLRVLGEVALEQGQRDRAAVLLEESLAIFRALQERWGMAVVLNDLGVLATDEGDYVRAQDVLEESLALDRTIGEKNRIAAALSYLGDVALYQGEYERALALNEESLALARALDTGSLARSLLHLGLTLRERGDLARADLVFTESLSMHRARGNRGAVAWCLEGLAGVACAQGQPDRAARLYGAAEALREAIGFPLPAGRRGAFARDVVAARAALGGAAFTATWAAGRAIPLEQIIAEVKASRAGRASPHDLAQALDDLTGRRHASELL